MTLSSSLRLSWPAPASEWSEAVPVGNGRLAGMVFGDGHIQLNDAFVWSGTPSGPASALRDVLAAGAGPARLQEVREAIDAEDYRRAESLLMSFEGPYSQEYRRSPISGWTCGVPAGCSISVTRWSRRSSTAYVAGRG